MPDADNNFQGSLALDLENHDGKCNPRRTILPSMRTGYTSQMSPLLVLKLTLQSLRNDFPSLQVLVQVLEAVLLPVSKQKKEKIMLNDVAT